MATFILEAMLSDTNASHPQVVFELIKTASGYKKMYQNHPSNNAASAIPLPAGQLIMEYQQCPLCKPLMQKHRLCKLLQRKCQRNNPSVHLDLPYNPVLHNHLPRNPLQLRLGTHHKCNNSPHRHHQARKPQEQLNFRLSRIQNLWQSRLKVQKPAIRILT
jgi:hypothetical protein